MEEKELLQLIANGEGVEVECKKAKGGLPKDMWETYSAFANTNGGIILLGVQQEGNTFFPIDDIDAPKLMKDFWDSMNNPQRISENILLNDDVQLVNVQGKQIVSIRVPRAQRQQRPIYIGHNPLVGTYRRNYEGDYKCTADEVKRMLADQQDSQDSLVLPDYTLEDLQMDSIRNYRRRFASLKPDHPWNALETQDFLQRIGAWGRNREAKKEGITLAGLIMFGEEHIIREVLPKYFLDYREKTSIQPDQRWTDRITSTDGTWSGNVYDFYFKVIPRLTSDLNIPFQLEGLFRTDDTRVHRAIREALVNTLVHADYYGDRGIVVEKGNTQFRFANPGTLRVSIEQARRGGVSDPRNENIFKMFMSLGLGERAGSGIENIHLAWKEQHWKYPNLTEEYQPDRTILALTTQSLLPDESVNFLKVILGVNYQALTKNEVLTLVTAHQEEQVTNQRLQVLMDQSSAEVSKVLSTLVEKEYLVMTGHGRGAKYILSDIFTAPNTDVQDYHNEPSMGDNEPSMGDNEPSMGDNEPSMGDNEPSMGDNESVLMEIAAEIRKKNRVKNESMRETIMKLCHVQPLTIMQLSQLLNRSQDVVKKHYVYSMVDEGLLEMLYPENRKHPKQAYRLKEK